VIYRSEAGIDIENPKTRIIDSTGFEEIARLNDGQNHTISIKTDVSGVRRIVRFTHRERE